LQIPWHLAVQLIEAGRVLIDKKFKFLDGEIAEKWLLILSDNLIEDSHVYCLTTSKVKTYQRSYADYISINHPTFGNKQIIIEIERIDLISIHILKAKYENEEFIIKNKAPSNLMNKIYNTIKNSIRIAQYQKDWLGL